jgi:NAD-dependent deacetylase
MTPADTLADWIASSRSVLFITGAGLSADSGMPTYRGVGGLYNGRTTDSGVPIEEALSGAMLRHDPDLCWRHLREIGAACAGVKPNRGHEVMARLEGVLDRVVVLTQNVDGLHRAAGSTQLIELHGSLGEVFCMAGCGHRASSDTVGPGPGAPRCPDCGAVLRPEVVLFGEMLPPAAVARYEHELRQGFDLVVAVGTTAVFPYIAGPVYDQARRGGRTAEINPGVSEVSGVVALHVEDGAAAVLDVVGRRLGV